LRLLLAVKLFELRRLSGGKAAEVAGMSMVEFLDELARFGVPTIHLEDDQLEDELLGG
jgi:predicted HTH domain antitoxin